MFFFSNVLTKTQKKAFERTSIQYGIAVPWDRPLIPTDNAPQQSCTSVDCGAVVLYIVDRCYKQEPIENDIGEEYLSEMRTKIVDTLLNWGDARSYFVDQLKKKRRFNIWSDFCDIFLNTKLKESLICICQILGSDFCHISHFWNLCLCLSTIIYVM